MHESELGWFRYLFPGGLGPGPGRQKNCAQLWHACVFAAQSEIPLFDIRALPTFFAFKGHILNCKPFDNNSVDAFRLSLNIKEG